MLFSRHILDEIRAGAVDLAFRRWRRPRVKVGTRLRTAAGVVEITDIRPVLPGAIGGGEATRAGFASPRALLARLGGRPEDPIFRIALRFAGGDPRVSLREAVPGGAEELAGLCRRIDDMEKRSRAAPWAWRTLAQIAARPSVRAAELAAEQKIAVAPFKARVRRLKELGLTESLDIGYRLSRRGSAVLAARERSGTRHGTPRAG